jgi:oligoribonuclease NrnB/cAMP/cGMP phosphodiesterase (DHH superfamily)
MIDEMICQLLIDRLNINEKIQFLKIIYKKNSNISEDLFYNICIKYLNTKIVLIRSINRKEKKEELKKYIPWYDNNRKSIILIDIDDCSLVDTISDNLEEQIINNKINIRLSKNKNNIISFFTFDKYGSINFKTINLTIPRNTGETCTQKSKTIHTIESVIVNIPNEYKKIENNDVDLFHKRFFDVIRANEKTKDIICLILEYIFKYLDMVDINSTWLLTPEEYYYFTKLK